MKPSQNWKLKIIASLSFALTACSNDFSFNEVKSACEPPPSSARFGRNIGPIITSPDPNQPANGRITVTGTCADGYPLTISGSGVVSPVSTSCSNGAFSVEVEFTNGDGTKEIDVKQPTYQGEDILDRRCFAQDTVPPKVVISGNNGAQTLNTESTILAGTCESGLDVLISGPYLTSDVTTSCERGRFGAAVTFTGPDGLKDVVARQIDRAGNAGQDDKQFLTDLTAPIVTIDSPAPLSLSRGEIVLEGLCEDGGRVLFTGSLMAGVASTDCIGGRYSMPVILSAGDGSKNIEASQTDMAGNTGRAERDFMKDATPPAVMFTGPAANFATNGSITVSGTCESDLNVSLSGAVSSPVSTPCVAGQFTQAITLASGDGNKEVVATQTDLAGNSSSDRRAFILDTQAPAVTIAEPAANSYWVSSTTVRGACEAGYQVNIAGSGLASAVNVSCANGTYESPVTLSTGDGVKMIQASQTDAAGNIGQATRSVIRDATGPDLTIASPTEGAYVGNSGEVSGTCETGLTVSLSGTGLLNGTNVMCAGGGYAATVTYSDGEGSKTFMARQTDAAGNSTAVTRTVIKDTLAPVVTINQPAANSIHMIEVNLSGSCENGLDVQIAGAGAQMPVSTSCSSGAFNALVTLSAGDGEKLITASQTDNAGNTGSDSRTFLRDATAPMIQITAPAVNTAAVSGLRLQGICETGLPVSLSGAGLMSPNSTTCAAGTFEVDIVFTAGDGVKSIMASQTDLSGNVASDSRNFIRDTVAPVVTINSPAANTVAQNGVLLQGSCETGLIVNLSGAGLGGPASTTCSAGGSYSVNILFNGGDGTKNIIVSQTDGAGNMGSANRDFIRDNLGPDIQITAPDAGYIARNGIRLEGVCEDGYLVNISGAGISAATSTSCSGGNFAADLTFSSGDGSKNVVVAQTDGAGNTGSDSRSFIRDTTPPNVRILSPAAGTSTTGTIQLAGQCENGLDVEISGAIQSPTSTNCSSGSFNIAITLTAGDGSKQVVVSQTDAAGNTGTHNRNFIRDTALPTIAITAPSAGTVAQNGVTLQGSCEAGLTVNLSGAGLQSPNSTTCNGGQFSVAIMFSSGEGVKNIIASQTDAAGNMASDNRDFVRDTTAPLVRILQPAAGTVAQTGVQLQGQCENGLDVHLSGAGLSAPSVAACVSGSFTADVTFSSGDGSKLIVASQTDAAGNTGSDSRAFSRDSGAPVIQITSPAANTLAQNGVRLEGICETGLSVSLGGSGLASPASTSCAAGVFSVDVLFTSGDGSKLISVSQTDGAGNTGSDSRSFIRDTMAPAIAITQPAEGTVATNGLRVEGTCESGLTVSLSGSGLSSSTSTSCADGVFAADILFSAGDGAKTVTASQTDAAGNTASSSRNFVRDGTAPMVTIASPAAGYAAQSGVTLTGACESGINVNISGSGLAASTITSCVGGNYSIAVTFSTGDGSKEVIASQTDSAGNTGSASRSFVRDNVAPVITINSPAANSYVSSSAVITGNCETGTSVSLSGNGLSSSVNTACVAGNYSASVTFTIGDGGKQVVASQTDAAGNTGSTSRDFIRDDTAPVIQILQPSANTLAQNGLRIEGVCEDGLTVSISGAGVNSPSSTNCSSGAFAADIIFSNGDGAKTVMVSQTDAAGNMGTDSRIFQRDTTAPVVTISAPAENTAAQASLVVSGNCEIGITVVLWGAGVSSNVNAACPAGTYSAEVVFTGGDGAKEVRASQTDSVGNYATAIRNFVRDTVAPAIAITSPEDGSYVAASAMISGTCESGWSVMLSGTGIAAESASCESGNFSATVTFTTGDGPKQVVATQTDSAGNSASDTRSFIRDSVAPAVAITSPAAGSAFESTLTLQGTCETGLNVVVAGSGIATGTTTSCVAGAFSVEIELSSGDGSKEITVSQTDAAGNTGTASRSFMRDSPTNSGYFAYTSNGPGGMVDILFVDDNSVSMDPEQAALGSRFSSFTTALSDVDWQVGITTTDCLAGSPYNICGSLLPMTGLNGEYILNETVPDYLNIFRNTIQRPETADCLFTGTCPSGREEGLKATVNAIAKRFTDNAGFFRDGADLAVVYLTDEDESSTPTATSTTPQQVVDAFRAAFGTSKKFSAYGIIVLPGDSECLAMQQSQVGTVPITVSYYGTYPDQLVNMTGGRSVSICEPDYSLTLTQIGNDVTRLSRSIDLPHTPIEGTVNIVFTPAYSTTWEVNGNRITFDVPAPAGTNVEVFYEYE